MYRHRFTHFTNVLIPVYNWSLSARRAGASRCRLQPGETLRCVSLPRGGRVPARMMRGERL